MQLAMEQKVKAKIKEAPNSSMKSKDLSAALLSMGISRYLSARSVPNILETPHMPKKIMARATSSVSDVPPACVKVKTEIKAATMMLA